MFSRRFLVLACLLAACSDTSKDPGQGTAPTVKPETCLSPSKFDCAAVAEVRQAATGKLVTQGGTVELAVGALAIGGVLDVDFVVKNSAALVVATPLRIDKVTLEPTAGQNPAIFECFDAAGTTPCAAMAGKWKRVVPPGGEEFGGGLVTSETVRVRYRQLDQSVHSARLCLSLVGDPTLNGKPLCATIQTNLGKPKLLVTPASVAFPYVAAGTSKDEAIKFTNVGDAALYIRRIDFTGDPAFAIENSGKKFASGVAVAFEPPLELAKGASHSMKVFFAPKDEKKRSGTLLVQSSDPSAPTSGTPVLLLGNSAVPCLLVTPSPKVNFGAVVLGKPALRDISLKNCGTEPIAVTKAALVAGGSDNFTLNWSKAVAAQPGLGATGPSETAPLKLAINAEAVVEASYTPDTINPVDPATNVAKPDLASLDILSNATPRVLQLSGIGVKEVCPQPKISVLEGEEVIPQTVLHLKGDASVAPGGGTIGKYLWTVKKQPEGSKQQFLPKPDFPNPTFTANVAGEYLFCLKVTDDKGQPSCEDACVTVIVAPTDCLHIELLWDTPDDKDQTNTGPAAGADMDLHFAHPYATGPDQDCDGTSDPWFNNPFDAFWLNKTSNWGSSAQAVPDDPHLDLDDTDGAGPENLNVGQPEGTSSAPFEYSIGVHYWNDHGYGTSFATVRVFVCGALAYEKSQVKMDPLDLWYVGKLRWPNAAMGSGTEPPMLECKQSGSACLGKKDPANPAGGKMWQANGTPCITPCYVSPLSTSGAGVCKKPKP